MGDIAVVLRTDRFQRPIWAKDISVSLTPIDWLYMMTSQMETFSALLAICVGNSPVTGEFPPQRPVTRSFDVYFDLRPNKRLSKQSWGWWFETLSRPLWRHRNESQWIVYTPTKATSKWYKWVRSQGWGCLIIWFCYHFDHCKYQMIVEVFH